MWVKIMIMNMKKFKKSCFVIFWWGWRGIVFMNEIFEVCNKNKMYVMLFFCYFLLIVWKLWLLNFEMYDLFYKVENLMGKKFLYFNK